MNLKKLFNKTFNLDKYESETNANKDNIYLDPIYTSDSIIKQDMNNIYGDSYINASKNWNTSPQDQTINYDYYTSGTITNNDTNATIKIDYSNYIDIELYYYKIYNNIHLFAFKPITQIIKDEKKNDKFIKAVKVPTSKEKKEAQELAEKYIKNEFVKIAKKEDMLNHIITNSFNIGGFSISPGFIINPSGSVTISGNINTTSANTYTQIQQPSYFRAKEEEDKN